MSPRCLLTEIGTNKGRIPTLDILKPVLNAQLKVFIEPAGWHVMPGQVADKTDVPSYAAGSMKTYN